MKKGLYFVEIIKNPTKYSPLVEVTGLEPTTSWSLTKRATKLRYTSVSLAKQHILLYRIYKKCQAIFPHRSKKFLQN